MDEPSGIAPRLLRPCGSQVNEPGSQAEDGGQQFGTPDKGGDRFHVDGVGGEQKAGAEGGAVGQSHGHCQ